MQLISMQSADNGDMWGHVCFCLVSIKYTMWSSADSQGPQRDVKQTVFGELSDS